MSKMPEHVHGNEHLTHRTAWIRAAVLGANDGLISTASLVVGVAAAGGDVLLAGVAGVVGGAMSMAAGEYVSVSSQADAENADIELEKHHLQAYPDYEIEELSQIYQSRGLNPVLARDVAEALMAHDALGAHTRDELGITEQLQARPLVAAVASFLAFVVGAIWPWLAAWFSPHGAEIQAIGGVTLVMLLLLGASAARLGGASMLTGALRVGFWGVGAMLVTAVIGRLFGNLLG